MVTLYVAPTKAAKGESLTCKTAKYRTIPAALKAAKAGDIVEVLLDNGGTHKVIKVMIEKNTIAFDFHGIYDDTGLSGLTQSGNIFVHVTAHVKS